MKLSFVFIDPVPIATQSVENNDSGVQNNDSGVGNNESGIENYTAAFLQSSKK